MRRPQPCTLADLTAGNVALLAGDGASVNRMRINCADVRRRLLRQQACGEKRITYEQNTRFPGGMRRFVYPNNGESLVVEGMYPLSVLLQTAARAADEGIAELEITPQQLLEPPGRRMLRDIRTRFWPTLVRRTDAHSLSLSLRDEKLGKQRSWVYSPESDPRAVSYFRQVAEDHGASFGVVPRRVTRDWFRSIRGNHGLLTLGITPDGGGFKGVPYTTPGGRFNELYGWDSYFMLLGLLDASQLDLALGVIENFIYQLQHYGKILNASRTWSLNRSHPPFFTAMIAAVYKRMDRCGESRAWLKRALKWADWEYRNVWTVPERTVLGGLQRYMAFSGGPPPEVEPNHFRWVFEHFASQYGMTAKALERRYREGTFDSPELDEVFRNDGGVRESGHDTTYRWGRVSRCSEFATVDLNSLLFRTERDMAQLIEAEFGGRVNVGNGITLLSKTWRERAQARRELMRRYMLCDGGFFFDYDVTRGEQRKYMSAVQWYPLYASDPGRGGLSLVSMHDGRTMIEGLLGVLEEKGAIVASTLESLMLAGGKPNDRQWDWPAAWPPHQILAWQACLAFGAVDEARGLSGAWFNMMAWRFAASNGMVIEKYNVPSWDISYAEYGTVGANVVEYPRTGFGWANASGQVAAVIAGLDTDRGWDVR